MHARTNLKICFMVLAILAPFSASRCPATTFEGYYLTEDFVLPGAGSGPFDVHPDGRALFLGEGVMRARHRDPQRHGAFNPSKLSAVEPNRPYEYTIEFWRPTGNEFARGHHIRIEISSSYYPYYLRNPNTGEDNIGLATKFQIARQTVFHDADRPSHVVLPVIPASH